MKPPREQGREKISQVFYSISLAVMTTHVQHPSRIRIKVSVAKNIIKTKAFRAKPYDKKKKCAHSCLRLVGSAAFHATGVSAFVINTRIYTQDVRGSRDSVSLQMIPDSAHYLPSLHGIALYLEYKLIIHEERW